jgi:hypothetical protein
MRVKDSHYLVCQLDSNTINNLLHPLSMSCTPSAGYGVIEPTCNAQANYIAVPGTASAYQLYSVDLDEIPRLHFPTG